MFEYTMIKTVILAGGSGTRLWPLSRTEYPKQFIPLFDNNSLFQLTVDRNKPFTDEFIVVTNEAQFFLVSDQAKLTEGQFHFILEPIGRNTAPAIALAALSLENDDIMLVTPSDHFIKNKIAYQALIKEGEALAKKDQLVTFGIRPTHAATGYGYIEANGIEVLSFKEKPDIETAGDYVKRGNFFWNSGMFMFKARVFLSELERFAPDILSTAMAAYQQRSTEPILGTTRIPVEAMANIPANSIDYAVMEHSHNISVIQGDIGWSDLGSFDELYDAFEKDSKGNAIHGRATSLNSNNNLIFSHENKMIATLGVNDLIIIDTGDALLVTQKGQSQAVKTLVETLNLQDSDLTKTHRTVHRPWGTYTILLEEPNSRYKLKKIVVKPKHKLSSQKHFHRNEHWIVVSGTAKIQNGNEHILLRENESTYIPMGQIHRLENPGKIDLVMIEAQVGSYLGEDDIVRLEDDFNRK